MRKRKHMKVTRIGKEETKPLLTAEDLTRQSNKQDRLFSLTSYQLSVNGEHREIPFCTHYINKKQEFWQYQSLESRGTNGRQIINWYNLFGNQFAIFCKVEHLYIQQFHSWVYISRRNTCACTWRKIYQNVSSRTVYKGRRLETTQIIQLVNG